MKHFLLLILFSTILYSDNSSDTLSIPSSNSITIRIENFQYGSGFYMSHWLGQEYGMRFGFGAFYASNEKQRWENSQKIYFNEKDIRLSPTIGIVKRFMTRANVAPYVGFESRLTWYLENGSQGKHTILKPSFVFGVEAYISEYFSISGEQSLTSNIYLNVPDYHTHSFGEGMLSASFYF